MKKFRYIISSLICIMALGLSPEILNAATEVYSLKTSTAFNSCTYACYTYDRSGKYNYWNWYNPETAVRLYLSSISEYDDYLITPELQLTSGTLYEWTFQPWQYSSSNKNSYIDLLVGRGDDPREYDVVKEVRGLADSKSASTVQSVYFTVPESGSYKLAFRAKQSCYLGSISVTDNGPATAPAAPADFRVVPDPDGAASVTVSFTMPSYNMSGEALPNSLTYNIYRKTQGATDSETVKTESASSGQAVSWTDVNAPLGTVTYSVQVSSSDGSSLIVDETTYVGPETPTAPTGVTLSYDGSNANLTWVAPEKGVHGAILNPENIKYKITRVLGGESTVVTENATGESFSDPVNSDTFTTLSYKIAAVYGELTSTEAASNSVKLGSISIPFADSFVNAQGAPAFNDCWTVETISGSYSWQAQANSTSNPKADPQDNDGGLAYYYSYMSSSGNECRLYTANIPKDQLDGAVVSFWLYINKYTQLKEKLRLEYSRDGGEWIPFENGLIEVEDPNFEGWKNFVYSLDEAIEDAQSGIRIAFTVVSGYTRNTLLDNVQIYNLKAHDLSVEKLSLSSNTLLSGNEATLSFEIANKGANDVTAEDYSLNLVTNYPGEIELPETVAIESNSSTEFSIVIPFTALEVNEMKDYTFTLELSYDADEEPSNNVSEEVSINVDFIQPTEIFPAVTELNLTREEDKSITLSWDSLVDDDVQYVDIKESFEDCEDGTTDTVNGWLLIDKDGLPATSEYNAAPSSKFTVATVEDGKPSQADGNKVIGLTYRSTNSKNTQNDWIISPRLDMKSSSTVDFSFLLGLRQVSFMYDYYSYKIYYSEEELNEYDPTMGFSESNRVDYQSSVSTGSSSKYYGEKMVRVSTDKIPASAKYIAIQFNSTVTYTDMAVWVDDLTIKETPSLTLMGYNVYEVGKGRLNAEVIPAENNSFSVPAISNAADAMLREPAASAVSQRQFFLTTVYPEGETVPTNIVAATVKADLQAVSIDAPATANVGENVSVEVEVRNVGDVEASSYTVQLLLNGQVYDSVTENTSLAPEEFKTFAFDYMFTVTSDETAVLAAKVIWEEDGNIENDITSQITIARNEFILEAPTGLGYENTNDGLMLIWSAPVNNLPEEAGLELIGYRVYRNGVEITDSPVEETSFVDSSELPVDTYRYTVVAVYNAGDSEASLPLEIVVTGIDGVSANGIEVRASHGRIAIVGADGMEAVIYNGAGMVMYHGIADAAADYQFESGIYVVVVDNKTFKIHVD